MTKNRLISCGLIVFILFFAGLRLSEAQIIELNEKIRKMGISPVKYRPLLRIDYSGAAEFKTVSRKAEYRIGELISIDMGLINISDKPINFLSLDKFAQIIIEDGKGNNIPVQPFAIADYFMSSANYTLLDSGEFDSASVLFVLGCNTKLPHLSAPRDVYNSNAFVSSGRGCIDVRKSGKYIIKASISNDLVVTKNEMYKTAIGQMESSPFELTIRKN